MKILKASNLACPIDGAPFQPGEKSLRCENGHNFDIARQGYVNLLPVQHRKSRQPGDSREMVEARTAFLDTGVYAPIAERLVQTVVARLPDGGDLSLVDAGCGEGYYLDYLVRELQRSEAGGGIACIGVDISRAAIIAATRRNSQVSWIVASNRQLPVLAASADMVICLFGFESPAGFKKILKPGGQVILVQPGPGHLVELRRIIYPQIRESGPPDPVQFEEAGFTVTQSRSLQFRTGAVGRQQIDSLLLMTPHLFRATREGKEAAARLESLDLTADVVFTSLVLNYN